MALLAVVADKAVVDTTPHLAHLRVSPVCGSLICLQGGGGGGEGGEGEGHRGHAQTHDKLTDDWRPQPQHNPDPIPPNPTRSTPPAVILAKRGGTRGSMQAGVTAPHPPYSFFFFLPKDFHLGLILPKKREATSLPRDLTSLYLRLISFSTSGERGRGKGGTVSHFHMYQEESKHFLFFYFLPFPSLLTFLFFFFPVFFREVKDRE